jgi:hypothetical protein
MRRRRNKSRSLLGAVKGGRTGRFEWQWRLQLCCGSAVAGAVRMKTLGNFAAPVRVNSQIALRARDTWMRQGGWLRRPQTSITNATCLGRVAVYSPTIRADRCHHSVLRCGRLAERKSGVTCILTAAAKWENNCVRMSRIRYSRQPAASHGNLWGERCPRRRSPPL